MAKYNLIIFHVPRRQQLSDFLTIRNMMAGRAPDIDVHVIPTAIPIPADFCRQAAERPTLIFSPMPLRLDPKFRGARLITCDRKKSEEVEMLTRAGFPVPDTRTITQDLALDETAWGLSAWSSPMSATGAAASGWCAPGMFAGATRFPCPRMIPGTAGTCWLSAIFIPGLTPSAIG